jgi:DNA-directed RNA polymerase specialized sigma24 family protein
MLFSFDSTTSPSITQASQVDHSCRRLRQLTRKLLHRYPPIHGRDSLEETLQAAVVRLRQALESVGSAPTRDYVPAAAHAMRQELAEVVRQYRAGEGPGAIVPTQELAGPGTRPDVANANQYSPGRCAAWLAFHGKVDELAPEARQAFDFLWYHNIPLVETARLLELGEPVLRQRWQQARLQLFELLGGQLPPDD